MSVTLYEPALRALLDSQDGPVGRYVQRIAEAVVVNAQFSSMSTSRRHLPAEQDIDFSMEGSTATIGYEDAGNKARRLARGRGRGKADESSIRQALGAVRAGD